MDKQNKDKPALSAQDKREELCCWCDEKKPLHKPHCPVVNGWEPLHGE